MMHISEALRVTAELFIVKIRSCNIQRFFTAVKMKISLDLFLDIFNNFARNIDCGYKLKSPQPGGSNEYPQSMFWIKLC